MKFINILYVIILLLLNYITLSCDSSNYQMLNASALKIYGRFSIDDEQRIELISSGAHFGFNFTGTTCEILATIPPSAPHNYLQYELDGIYQKRVKLNPKSRKPIKIKAPTAGNHTIWFYKATEAHTGPILIEKVVGKSILPIKKAPSPLIEFIGDSITCGAGADPSDEPCHEGYYHDQHNAYLAYGPLAARALKTDFILNCVSGIGVYRNTNNNGPTMPQVYEKLNFKPTSTDWTSDNSSPQIVSIALGTNDFSPGDGSSIRAPFDSVSFIKNYVQFIRFLKSKNPQARIALLSSPMLNENHKHTLQNCLRIIKKEIDAMYFSDKPIELHFFELKQTNGCTGHPSIEDHANMADELIPFYKNLLQS